LKLQCGEPLSNFAFKFNLRRYTVDGIWLSATPADDDGRVAALLEAPQVASPSRGGRTSLGESPPALVGRCSL
jgi:hypothetical protein